VNDLTHRRCLVDLSSGRIARDLGDPSTRPLYFGGRGATVARLLGVLRPGLEPLAPGAPLVFGVGPIVGTGFPGAARFNVSGRSPQTGILGDSNAGGRFGPALRRACIDGLEIVGQAERPTLLFVDGDRAELLDATDLWGLDVTEATDAIGELLGGGRIEVATVGPAAERGVAFSGIFTGRVRAAARTGMGRLMASKNLKAIAVRGTGDVPMADPDRARELFARVRERILEHPEYEIRSRLGTTQLVTALQRIGGLPTRHFQSGTFEHADAVSGERIEAVYKVRSMGCESCVVHCSRHVEVDDPRFPGLAFEGPEYEPLAGFTARVGNADLPLALYAVDRCNRLGLDAITTSEVIAWAMECAETGLIGADVAGGLDLSFGCGETLLVLIEQIAVRKGFGDVLADGVRAAAERLGFGRELAMHVKGLELFQADVRAMKAYGLGNAVASRGADHLRSEPWFEFSGDREAAERRYGVPDAADRLAWRGKGLVVKDYEERAAVADALGICKNLYNNMEILDWEETAEVVNAVTGLDLAGEDVRRAGERIVNAERLINARFGIERADDTLPKRFLEEPAGPPDSPSAGSVVELKAMLEDYYAARGWDVETGLPARPKLDELGLGGE
jgi:aldehyde:ferredoxin oxidoreductase